MAIVIKENERLYLRTWEYNAARILSYLAKIVENEGGRVKKLKNAVITDSSLETAIRKTEEELEFATKHLGIGNSEMRKYRVDSLTKELEKLKSIDNEPITVGHTTYIKFYLDGFVYYYQVEENPFFEFYYSKDKVTDGKYAAHSCLIEDKKGWLWDEIFKFGCKEEIISKAAHFIFDMLVSSDSSRVPKEYRNKETLDF